MALGSSQSPNAQSPNAARNVPATRPQASSSPRGMTNSLDSVLSPVFGVVERIAPTFLRVALGVVLLWIALLKFHDPTPVVGLIKASFLFSFLGSPAFVYAVGVLEVVAALLLFFNIGVRYVALLVVLLFVGTLGIFLTAPAAVYGTGPGSGFPYLTLAGQFLLKDLVLMASAFMVAAIDIARQATGAPASGPVAALRAKIADLRRRMDRMEGPPTAS